MTWHRNSSRTEKPRTVGDVSSGLLVAARNIASPTIPARSESGGNWTLSNSLAGASLTALWERERLVRILLVAAAVGFVLVGVLSVALKPTGDNATLLAQSAQRQANLVSILLAHCP